MLSINKGIGSILGLSYETSAKVEPLKNGRSEE